MKILKIPQLNVTDDKYHTVIVKREGNRASLQIDYSGKVEGTTGGVHKLLNMGGGSFFTGGLPNVTEVCFHSFTKLLTTLTLPGPFAPKSTLSVVQSNHNFSYIRLF